VVRNHEDGTSETEGIRLAEATVARRLWEWTRTDESMKRRAGGTPARVGRTNPKGVRLGKARARQAHRTRAKSMEGVFGATQEASEHRERESPERQHESAKAKGVAGKTNDLRRLTVGNTK